jgi:hypothetical protein
MGDGVETDGRADAAREFETIFRAYLDLENNVEAYAGESMDERTRATIEDLVGGRMNPDEAHAFLAELKGRPGAVGHLARRLRETMEAGETERPEE